MEEQKVWRCNTCKTIVLSVDYPKFEWDDGHRCVFMIEKEIEDEDQTRDDLPSVLRVHQGTSKS